MVFFPVPADGFSSFWIVPKKVVIEVLLATSEPTVTQERDSLVPC
jgi:hypothetical protein